MFEGQALYGNPQFKSGFEEGQIVKRIVVNEEVLRWLDSHVTVGILGFSSLYFAAVHHLELNLR